jgi:uncharacterized membrane protein SpoIIM required for sporulation
VPSDLLKFLESREDSYIELEALIENAESGGLRKFDRHSLVEFGRLYRMAAADLARARYVLRSPLLAEYLNELVGRAHHLIHRRRTPFSQGLIRFFTRDFPLTVRREIKPVLISLAFLLGASIVGGVAYSYDREWGQLVMAQPELRAYEKQLEDQPTALAADIDESLMPVASAFIISNNIRACITAIAGGLLFGLGTLAALLYNGFLLGVVGSMFLNKGAEYDLYFWAGVLPHGVLELPAVAIAGGGGLLLARGLLIPGRLMRGDSVRIEGRSAMVLLGGVMMVMVFAGLIEGFITPLDPSIFPSWAKLAFAAVVFAAFVFYILRTGLDMEMEDPELEQLRTSTSVRLD